MKRSEKCSLLYYLYSLEYICFLLEYFSIGSSNKYIRKGNLNGDRKIREHQNENLKLLKVE